MLSVCNYLVSDARGNGRPSVPLAARLARRREGLRIERVLVELQERHREQLMQSLSEALAVMLQEAAESCNT